MTFKEFVEAIMAAQYPSDAIAGHIMSMGRVEVDPTVVAILVDEGDVETIMDLVEWYGQVRRDDPIDSFQEILRFLGMFVDPNTGRWVLRED